jgi:prevent-host-death family protein
MKTVPAKELKFRLGQYLRDVQAGETVRVTVRGKPVADIQPLPAAADERLAALIRAGRASPPARVGRMPEPTPMQGRASPLSILLDDRSEG